MNLSSFYRPASGNIFQQMYYKSSSIFLTSNRSCTFILVSDYQSEVKMGTYTTNKNLFMPSVGEQGWGDLVNGNFETIDNFLKPITVSGSTYTFTGSHVGNQSGGSISATSITNSGTLTQTGTSTFTGKITANGGIGTKALTATSISNSGTLTQTGTSTFTGKITANGGVNNYEERITTLESGEFETIKGARVGTFTLTAPNIWSIANTVNYTHGHAPSGGGSKTSEFTPTLTELYSWDEIVDIDNITYTCVYSYGGGDYAWKTLDITFTNILTNESTNHSISVGKSSKTFTLTAHVFSKITCVTTMTSIWNEHTGCSINISRPDIYFTHA